MLLSLSEKNNLENRFLRPLHDWLDVLRVVLVVFGRSAGRYPSEDYARIFQHDCNLLNLKGGCYVKESTY